MQILADIAREALQMYLEAAPWLILGVVAAGLVHAFVPQGLLGRWLGGSDARNSTRQSVGAVLKAALIGAPLPLCSCGVLPAAVGLRREGASKAATVSFLIATPETGPDSVAVSYALLGPVMAVARPVAAVLSAVFAGLLTLVLTRGETDMPPPAEPKECCGASCAANATAPHDGSTARPDGSWNKLRQGLTYGFTDILDDIALWLAVGLGVAGVLAALVPPLGLAQFGSGIGAMVVMLAVGVPLYVCATASTPIAAGLIAAGLSPGAALVFLLAGPATNIATLGVVGKDLGPRALVAYLGGIAVSALIMGLSFDALLALWRVDIHVQMHVAAATVPEALKMASGLVLAPFFARSLVKEGKKRLAR